MAYDLLIISSLVWSGLVVKSRGQVFYYRTITEDLTPLLAFGKNCLLAWHDLMKLEIAAIAHDSGPPRSVYSDTGNWFPELTELVSPVPSLEALKCLDQSAREQGFNRMQRRALNRKTFKGSRFRPEAKRFLLAQQEAGLKEILSNYPMREQDALVLSNYILGKVTAQEVEGAFLASLRDPRWMMKWFQKHSDQLSPIIQWLRGPSEDMRKTIAGIAERISELRERHPAFGHSSEDTPGFNSSGKQQMQLNVLKSLTGRLAESMSLSSASCENEANIYRNAPGLTVMVSAGIDSMWNAISEKPREPKASDFVDIVHALYVPYVDVFRADAYMAPLVSKAAECYGTTVIGRLKDIVVAIEEKLAS